MNEDSPIFISNRFLRAGISCLGAELVSLTDDGGREYMWQRDATVWNRSAPILFPVIGRLRDGRYTHHGTEYRMGRHGFARDSVFRPTELSGGCVEFCLEDSPESREIYPFGFELSVSYELQGTSLIKKQRVENRSDETMLYELGGHDGFLLPEDMTRCELSFPEMDRISLLRGGGESALANGTLSLNTELFRNGALLMRTPGNGVELCCGSDYRVTVCCAQFPYLALWTPYPTGNRLLCVEPWSTIPDNDASPFELSEKPDVLSLRPGESRTHSYVISMEEICSEKY